MKREHQPEVRRAKALCFFVIVGATALLILGTKIPAIWAFGNSSDGWGSAIIVAAVLVIVARRAIKSSR